MNNLTPSKTRGGQYTKEPSPLYLAATGICLECLNLNLKIVLFSNTDFSTSGVVSGATPYTHTPLTTPLAEQSWLEKKDDPITTE